MNPLRKALFWLHLIAGLGLSLYAIVIGATGAVLAFHEEIEYYTDAELHRGTLPANPVAPDVAIALARQQRPKGRALSVTFPNEGTPFWSTYMLEGPDTRVVYVDPASGRLHAVVDPKAGFAGWLEQLHFNLLASRTGRLVNGYGALGLLFLGLSGLALWFSGSRVTRVRWRAGGRARHADLHQVAGLVTLVFLIAISVTGAWFTWSKPYLAFVNTWFERTKEPKARIDRTLPPLSVAELAARARAALPGKTIHRISLSDKSDQIVRVTLREGAPGEFHRVSTVLLDPRSGDVLHVTRHADRPTGDSLVSWLSAFHFGVWGGWPVKLLWFILGMSLPLLAVTGWLMWLRRVWR